MYSLASELAQRDIRAVWEDPESWIHRLRERKHKGVKRKNPVLHIIECCTSLITVQQDAHTAGVWILQHGLNAVVPCRKLNVKPFHTPGFRITAQTTGWTLSIDFTKCKPQSTEVVAAHFDFPVMAPLREALCAEHLRANGKASMNVWIVGRLICDCGFGEIFREHNPLVSRFDIKIEDGSIYKEKRKHRCEIMKVIKSLTFKV